MSTNFPYHLQGYDYIISVWNNKSPEATYKSNGRPKDPSGWSIKQPKIFAIKGYINKSEYCQMRTAHNLNKPLNSDQATQPSSIGGPLGNQ